MAIQIIACHIFYHEWHDQPVKYPDTGRYGWKLNQTRKEKVKIERSTNNGCA